LTLFLSVDQVIRYHDALSPAPLIARDKLEGAVMRPQAGYGGHLAYPSLWMQASVLLHGITQAHAFLKGNKRTAWTSAVAFLKLNGVLLGGIAQEDFAAYVEAVARHEHTEQETALWLAAHQVH
jgi:death-on-curing protein